MDTANRLQGRQFEVVVAWHPLSGRRDASAFHLEAGRLCVLASRHRQDAGICWKYCDHPVQPTGLTSAGFLAGGFVHALAATPNGAAYAWGNNDWGQLGNGTFDLAKTPTPITGITIKH